MNSADYQQAWATNVVSAIGIDVRLGVSLAGVAGSVERQFGSWLPLRTETRTERIQLHQRESRAVLARLSQISALVLIAAVLAMAAAMGGMIWQRRSTLAALKVHGFSEFELWRASLLESSVLLGSGCLIGAVFGLFGQVLLDRALEVITGFPVIYELAGSMAIGILLLITSVAVAVLAIPGWLAVRVHPMAGISN